MDQQFEAWINLSFKAPSGDNCQPWTLTFVEKQFRIAIDHERARHFLDQDLSASWISVGCLCENLYISAKSFGFECRFVLESPDSVIVLWEKKNEELSLDVETLNAIRTRQTFRGGMGDAQIDLNEYSSFYVDEPDRAGFEWKITSTVSKKLLKEWSWLETVLWLKTSLMSDFTHWLRFKPGELQDGVMLANLKIPIVDQICLAIFKKFKSLIHWVPFYIFEVKSYLRLKFLIEKSAGVLSLVGPVDGYKDYFRAGREVQRMWLYLTKKKLKLQPLAIQSLFLNFISNPSVKKFLTQGQVSQMQSVKKATYRELNISKELVFSFRFGQSDEEVSPLPRRWVEIK